MRKSVVKDVKYMNWVKKRLVWVFKNRGERGDDNETSLKEGGGYRNVNLQVLSIYAMHRSPSLGILTSMDSRPVFYLEIFF